MTRQLLIIFLSNLLCLSLYAQIPPAGTGCYYNGRLYYRNVQPTTTFGLNYRYRYDPAFYYELTCTNNEYPDLVSVLTTGIFAAPVNCGTTSSYFANDGTMYYFNLIACPLDRLSIFLLIPLSALAYRYIKRNKTDPVSNCTHI